MVTGEDMSARRPGAGSRRAREAVGHELGGEGVGVSSTALRMARTAIRIAKLRSECRLLLRCRRHTDLRPQSKAVAGTKMCALNLASLLTLEAFSMCE